MAGRTNFVKVSNLPQCYTNGIELFNCFSQVGQVQDITAVDPTTVIVSFAMRSQADNAEFALNNTNLAGISISVQKYFPQTDPQFLGNNPVYRRLGEWIGQDFHVMQPQNFRPWPSFPQNFQPLQSSNFTSAAAASHSQPAASNYNNYGNHGNGASSSGQQINGSGDLITDNTTPWVDQGNPDDECAICLLNHDNNSLTLVKCGHTYHRACLERLMANSSNTFIECPTCKTVYGVRTGNMPTSGSISHRIIPQMSLPGFEGSGTLEIHFNFHPGIQGPEHPNPGQPYTCSNFPRTAYLPDNRDGEMMLHGVYMAWNQRLMFTVGQSVTTGQQNVITWNDIHMKTKPHGGQHGFPDPNYMNNLKEDLRIRGITEAAILEHMRKHPNLRTNGRM